MHLAEVQAHVEPHLHRQGVAVSGTDHHLESKGLVHISGEQSHTLCWYC